MKLAILDRHGTLDVAGAPQDWQALPGALEAVARLNRAGWHVVLATQRPELGLGQLRLVALNAAHVRMHRELAAVGGRIEAVFYCPHAPHEDCTCRLPAPGLLQQICERLGAQPQETWVIGSSTALLQGGAQLGAHLHWVRGGALPPDLPPGVHAHASLAELVEQLAPAEPGPMPGAPL